MGLTSAPVNVKCMISSVDMECRSMEVICVSDTVKHGPIECMISALGDMKH